MSFLLLILRLTALVKKTFTILQLITYLSESSPEIEPENESLRACWREFAVLGRDSARLRQTLADEGIEEWCVCYSHFFQSK